MASKAAFSTDEWKQVLGGVFMAGFAVTAADPSGLWGLLKETFASGRALMEAKSNAGASELSKAIVSDIETTDGRAAAQEFVKGRLHGAKREEIKQRAKESPRVLTSGNHAETNKPLGEYRSMPMNIADARPA